MIGEFPFTVHDMGGAISEKREILSRKKYECEGYIAGYMFALGERTYQYSGICGDCKKRKAIVFRKIQDNVLYEKCHKCGWEFTQWVWSAPLDRRKR